MRTQQREYTDAERAVLSAALMRDLERDVDFSPMQYIPGGEGGETRVRLSDASVDVGQLHVDYTLTNVSVAYQNAAYIAEAVAPVVPVNLKSNKYWVYGKERFRRKLTSREPGTSPRETGWSLSTDSYFCQGHSLRGWYPWEGPAAADGAIDLDIDTTENTTEQVLLAQEMDLVDTLSAGLTSVDLSADGGGNYQFDNPDVDPILYFDKKKETVAKAIGRRPNALALGMPAYRGLRNNQKLIARVFGTTAPSNPLITPQMLAEKLDVQEVLVGEALYDTVAEGETSSLDYIWGQNLCLFYKEPQPGRRKVSLAYHFLWNVGNAGRIVEKWYDQDRKRYVIDVNKYRDQKIVASGAGLWFTKALANG
jgi:hypothetical protein